MSLNENLKTRRTQLAVLASVIAVGAATAGGVMWYGNHQEQQKHPAPVAAPNMTGVVTASFNEQVNDAALAQQQAKTSALEQQFATLAQQFTQNKLTTEQKLAEKDAEIQRLTDQVQKAPGGNTTTGQQTPPAGQNGTPLPGPVAAGLPIATPTAFVVNVNTLKAYPLTQGTMELPTLESRWASLIQADMDNVDPNALPPLPASAQVTPQ